MTQREYLQILKQKLYEFYSYDENESTKTQALRDYIKGYVEAGISLDALSNRQFETIAEEIHISVFGKTVKERDLDEWEKYDEPPYIRKKQV